MELGTTTNVPDGGQDVLIGGRPARVVERDKDWAVVVDAGAERLFSVHGTNLGRDDLVERCQAMVLHPEADLSWLGSAAIRVSAPR